MPLFRISLAGCFVVLLLLLTTGYSHARAMDQSTGCPTLPSGSISPDTAIICAGSSQVLTATGGRSYQWYLDGVPIAGATASRCTATVDGTYTVMLFDGPCSAPAQNSAVITLSHPPVSFITPDSGTICNNGAQYLSITGGVTYQWYRDGVLLPGESSDVLVVRQAGNYTVSITDSVCTAMSHNTARIVQVAQPVNIITPAFATICEGKNQRFNTSGPGPFQWYLDGAPLLGATINTFLASQPGTYSIRNTSPSCPGLSPYTALLVVQPTPTGTITPARALICDGVPALLTVSGGHAIQWQRSGIDIPGATAPTFTATSPGKYRVKLTTGTCVGYSSETIVTADRSLRPQRYLPVRVVRGRPFPLQARNVGQHYVWSPATGLSDPAVGNPVITTSTDRLYTVTISSPDKCPVTDTIPVLAFESPGVYVPTAFTPNGDGRNDLLRPIPVHLLQIVAFRVYNRWGQEVFSTSHPDHGWNGTLKGVMQPAGAYLWTFEGKDASGQLFQEKGTFVLIR